LFARSLASFLLPAQILMAKLLAISSFWKAAGMTRFSTLFQKPKPVIAMVHLGALPGSPLYDAAAGLEGLLSAARADLMALQAAGVDAVMFGNENDRPYEFQVTLPQRLRRPM
jgi:hypothetical protein